MEPTSKHQGHKLVLKAKTDNHEAATGADVQLEIDGQPFNANYVSVEADAGGNIIKAYVEFAVSDLQVHVSALTHTNQIDGDDVQVRDIILETKPCREGSFDSNPMILMGLDVKPTISTAKDNLLDLEYVGLCYEDVFLDKVATKTANSIYIAAEAGKTVYAEVECNPFKKSFGEKYPLAKLDIEKLVEENEQLSD